MPSTKLYPYYCYLRTLVSLIGWVGGSLIRVNCQLIWVLMSTSNWENLRYYQAFTIIIAAPKTNVCEWQKYPNKTMSK